MNILRVFSFLMICGRRESGKLLLDFVKNRKAKLSLNVYQKNTRAIHFYQREGFAIRCEGVDEATSEKEYVMTWENFYNQR